MMPSPFVSLSAILAIPIAAHFLLPMPRAHMYEPKHLFMLQPMALLTVAALAHGRRWKAIRLALLLGIAMVNVAGLVNYFRIGLEKEPWRELVAHISSRTGSGDAILFSPAYAGHAFEWYYGGAIPCAGVPEERGRFAERMERELRPTVRRIWLIQCRNAVSTPNPEAAHWLETHWQREESGLLAGILSGEEGGLAYAAYRRPPD